MIMDDRPSADDGTSGSAARRRIVSKVFASVAASVPASVPVVRAWTRGTLQRFGVGADVAERVELLVSEVATNAVRHTVGPRFTVRLDVDSGVRAAVHDDAPEEPQLRQARAWDTGGRGMHLVEAMADAWGTRAERGGKWVCSRARETDDGHRIPSTQTRPSPAH
jgi:anti-sigma regulatory factor (Ser/Thr protein kinase)